MAKRKTSPKASKKKVTKKVARKRGPDKKPRKQRSDAKTNHPPKSEGRPQGSTNALPRGSVQALRGLRYRVPDTCPQPLAELADEAVEVVADVLRGNVPTGQMQHRLKAATILRNEACGPIPKTVEHQHAGSMEINVVTGVPRMPSDEGAEEPETVLAEIAASRSSSSR